MNHFQILIEKYEKSDFIVFMSSSYDNRALLWSCVDVCNRERFAKTPKLHNSEKWVKSLVKVAEMAILECQTNCRTARVAQAH